MVTVAAGAVIVFAARAGLAANQQVVEVMHLVGATNGFIANEVQRRYLTLGLRGGIIGTLIAAVVLFASASFGVDGDGVFLPNLAASPLMLGWLALVPLILCGIASGSARLTVLRTLAQDMI
jgi:cell division transport system permease protein